MNPTVSKTDSGPDAAGRLFAGEGKLILTGLLGLVMAAGVRLLIMLRGPHVLPEGDLESAFSFNAAIGIFVISLAAILPLTGMTAAGRRRLRALIIPVTLYAYLVETIQHARGINPRFSKAGGTLDTITGQLFGLDSLLIMLAAVLIAIPFFRRRPAGDRTLLVLGIRYAFASTMLAFAAGFVMIALTSRYTGDSGNLMILHGLGFHGLQALPLLGWLLEPGNERTVSAQARRLLHIGGITWNLSVVLIALQTLRGVTVFEVSPLPVLTLLLLLVWGGTAGFAFLSWLRRSRVWEEEAAAAR